MIFWISLLMLTLTAYALLVIWALPKLMLKIEYPLSHPTDRGLKKYVLNESDYAVVYEPSLSARKYITQYIIAKKGNAKVFTCKLSPDVVYIDYDIVLFNASGNCFQVINSMAIKDDDSKYPEITLPDETAYASVVINQVNNAKMKQAPRIRVAPARIVFFGILSLILSVGMAVGSLYSFSNIFGGLFRETFVEEMLFSGWIFIFPSIISVVCITAACCVLFSNYSKKTLKGENNG